MLESSRHGGAVTNRHEREGERDREQQAGEITDWRDRLVQQQHGADYTDDQRAVRTENARRAGRKMLQGNA